MITKSTAGCERFLKLYKILFLFLSLIEKMSITATPKTISKKMNQYSYLTYVL